LVTNGPTVTGPGTNDRLGDFFLDAQE
jgi:hypothetical protein